MNKRLAISLGLLLTVVAQATEVTGVVRDGEGQPVEGAEIQILPTHTKTVTSDQDGAYQLTWQAEEWWDDDVVYYIVVRDQERQQAVALPIGKETISIDLTLQPALTLTGQVVDENGQGIGGATIHVMMRASYWGSSLFNSSDSPTTDDQGHFEIGDLPPAVRYGLTASAKGYGTSDLDVSNTEEAQGGRLEVGKLTLTVANQKVSGRLIDQTGKPISGLTLRCYGDGQPDCEATTDAQGAFHFDALCEGPVTLNAHGRIEDQQISCRATTLAGTKDIELMAIPGQNMPHRFIRSKSYEDILATEMFVAGRVVDETGDPVPNVPINVNSIRREREPGKYSWTYSNYNTLGDVTDEQGRFVIEVEEDAAYSLCLSPLNHAAMMIYDLPMGTRDDEVVLSKGGTVRGWVMRMDKGQKVPIANVEVRIEQTDRSAYSHIGFDQDRTVKTDSDGRFCFEHLRRVYRSDRNEEEYSPRIWEVRSQGLSQTVGFYDDEHEVEIELLVKPKLDDAKALQGQSLPGWETLGLPDLDEATQNQALLICFFNYEQRLDRRRISQLAQQQEALRDVGVTLLPIDISGADSDNIQTWLEKLGLEASYQITADLDEIRFLWNIQSLPWLIQTDSDHLVKTEGMDLENTLKKEKSY